MSERNHVRLVDLPQFTIQASEMRPTELVGLFDQVGSVRVGPAWLYRSNGRSVGGELVSLALASHTAVIEVADREDLQPGDTLPYFHGYFEPRGVDMIGSA